MKAAGLTSQFIPVLKTERLILQMPHSKDLQALHRIYSNPTILQFCDLNLHQNLKDTEGFLQNIISEIQDEKAFYWGIIKDSELIGLCRFYHWNKKHQFISLGFELAQECWKHGLMQEALSASINYLFEFKSIHRIEAQVFSGHTRSIKLLEKLSFQQEGLMRQNFLIAGKMEDSYLYSKLATEQ
jgi:[ribosomal protein S5]-alanine N-acetyltransferase